MGPPGEFRRQPYISKHISEHIEAKNQNPKIPSCCFSQTYNLKEILGINHLDFTDYSKIYPDIASSGAF